MPRSPRHIEPLPNAGHVACAKCRCISHEEIDYELAEVDFSVPIRLCASPYHMAASRPSWPGVRMLYRLRTRVTVFGATNENRHQTGTTTRPLSNCWDEQRPVRRNANLSFSRTRSGVVIDASPAFLCRIEDIDGCIVPEVEWQGAERELDLQISG